MGLRNGYPGPCAVCSVCGGWRLVVSSSPQDFVEDEQCRATGDSDVGDVEGRVVPAGPVKVQEVNHVAVPQAVGHVTYGAAQDAG